MSEDLIGQQIGPYQIVEFMGYDGIVEVYLGHHPELERNVLVRIAGRHLPEDPVFSARFRREAKGIARLRHPGVTRLFDYGAIQGGHYIVSEAVTGTPLSQLLDEVRSGERTFEPDDVAFIIRQVAAAVDHAHANGVIHREVTPYNVILTRSGQAILDGFGLSLLRSRETGDSASLPLEYLAPEQVTDPRAASPTSDIYTLGVVLYELTTGELPFQTGSDIDDALRNLHDSAPDPRYLNEDIPPVVAQVVQKALARSPKDRFSNAMQIAGALEWAYAHPDAEALPQAKVPPEPVEAVAATPEPTTPPAERVVIKRRPSRREERREKRRLHAEHRRIQHEELVKQKRLERARQQAERQAAQLKRQTRRRAFFSNWGRSIVVLLVALLLLVAAGYLLQTIGVLSVSVLLPTLPTRNMQAAEAPPSPTLTPTSTNTPTPTITPSPTPLQSVAATPVPPLQFAPLDVGTSAYRIHDGGVMQFIPAGRFLMGTDDPTYSIAHRPQHPAMLTDYWIDRTEVTNAQYRQCVDAEFCQPPRDLTYYNKAEFASFPVTFINYETAAAYCLWLASRTGQIVGLPTEAQWEKAAGWDPVEGRARTYPWGDDRPTPERLRYVESGSSYPAAPVATHPAGVSAYGVHDMAGNVWEWVADWFSSDYYNRTGISLDPAGPLSGTTRVTRGGSWTRQASLAVTIFRNPVRPTTFSNEIGFRCAMSAERPPAESGILLSPLEVTSALTALVEETKDEHTSGTRSDSVEGMLAELDGWLEALTKIDVALKNGDNQTALVLTTRRLTHLDAQRDSGLFADDTLWLLENGLRWMEDQLTPKPTPTPAPTVTPSITPTTGG